MGEERSQKEEVPVVPSERGFVVSETELATGNEKIWHWRGLAGLVGARPGSHNPNPGFTRSIFAASCQTPPDAP